MRFWPVIFTISVSPVIAAVVCGLLMWSVHLWSVPPWCVALIGILLTLGGIYSAWNAARSMAARRFRFRLRTFLAAVAAIAVILGVASRSIYPRLSQGYAVQAVAGNGGYPGHWVEDSDNWLEARFGYDPFDNVDEITIGADRAIPVLLSYNDQFSAIEQLTFVRGATDAALRRASEFNSFAKLRFGAFILTPLTDKGLLNLKDWTRVRSLFFNSCAFTDKGLAHLADLPELESLDLIGDEGGSMTITDSGMVHVGQMSRLKRLGLKGIPVTDAGLAHLMKLRGLERLSVRRTAVTENGLEKLRNVLPDCWAAGMKDSFPSVNQIERIRVCEDSAREEDSIVILDADRIAEIKACLERYVGDDGVRWQHEWEQGAHGSIRVDFEGRSRRLCSCQIGDGFLRNGWGLYRALSKAESKEFRMIVGLSAKDKAE